MRSVLLVGYSEPVLAGADEVRGFVLDVHAEWIPSPPHGALRLFFHLGINEFPEKTALLLAQEIP